MQTHADNTQQNSSKAIANNVPKQQSEGDHPLMFEDNRPVAIQMRAYHDMANNSLQVRQLSYYQQMADKNESVTAKSTENAAPQQSDLTKKNNITGLPDQLKSGIENLSGYSLDDVKVHYNSEKPAQLQAHAYAQGTDIHIASGQEKHLPHEAWHIVQQRQGRVKPTVQMKGDVKLNNDSILMKVADVMGNKSLYEISKKNNLSSSFKTEETIQMKLKIGQDEYDETSLAKLKSKILNITEFDGSGVDINEILEQILSSSEILEYKTIDALKNDIIIRANKVLFTYETLNFEFSHGTLDIEKSNFWIPLKPRDGAESKTIWGLKDGVSPFNAVRELNSSNVKVECGAGIQIVELLAIAKTLGQKTFDEKFTDIVVSFNDIQSTDNRTGGMYNFQKSGRPSRNISKIEDLIIGDLVYFENYPDYKEKCSDGSWMGENAIYQGNKMFWGHGVGEISESDIIDLLKNQYIKEVLKGNKSELKTIKTKETTNGEYPGLSKEVFGIPSFY